MVLSAKAHNFKSWFLVTRSRKNKMGESGGWGRGQSYIKKSLVSISFTRTPLSPLSRMVGLLDLRGLILSRSWIFFLLLRSNYVILLWRQKWSHLSATCAARNLTTMAAGKAVTGVKVGSPHSMKHRSTLGALCGSGFNPDRGRRHAKLILKRYGLYFYNYYSLNLNKFRTWSESMQRKEIVD